MSIRGIGRSAGRSKPRAKNSKGSRERLEENAEAQRIRNREADTIFWVSFTPIGQDAPPPGKGHIPTRDDPWRIIIPGNPDSNPDFISRAIREFEVKHNVKEWREIASVYTCFHENVS